MGSEEFLDLEVREKDPLLKQKEELKIAIEKATPDKVQEILRMLGVGKAQLRGSNKRRSRAVDFARLEIRWNIAEWQSDT